MHEDETGKQRRGMIEGRKRDMKSEVLDKGKERKCNIKEGRRIERLKRK